jgi:hypothetical protein
MVEVSEAIFISDEEIIEQAYKRQANKIAYDQSD